MFKKVINPFIPNAPILYPLKTSENRKVFLCFQRVEKGCTGNEWVKNVGMRGEPKGIQMIKHCILEWLGPISSAGLLPRKGYIT